MLGSQLKGGEVIELRSDLGGGKTTFARGLAKGAGSQDRAASPTFTLSRIYKTPMFDIHHFDFYRLNDPGILADQLSEAMADNNVVLVEWADIVKNVLPEARISIEFQPTALSPDARQISISYPESSRPIIEYLESNFREVQP